MVIEREQTVLGVVGLGQMGGPMARNLAKAGWKVHVYDLEDEKVAACVEEGAVAAQSVADVVDTADVVMTSLPYSHTFVDVMESHIVPHAREGQVFIDLGTVEVDETQRLAAALAAKGATLLDVPVSGGHGGAVAGTLRMFGAGDRATFDEVQPILEVLGEPDHIVYCGESSMGQIVKGVNQLGMGLAAAAGLEAVAYGILAGADPEAIAAGVGGDDGWRRRIRETVWAMLDERAEHVGVKYGQLRYFIESAEALGFDLPLSRALYAFMEGGELCTVEANRPSPSFWRELNLATRDDGSDDAEG
jgi:3-hydroxyisobutyrate dehydrogenase-like beta-hydroxyacid dehydrogenase